MPWLTPAWRRADGEQVRYDPGVAPRRQLLGLLCAAATACNLLNGAADLGVGETASVADAATDAVQIVDASEAGDARGALDAGAVVDAVADTATVDAALARYPAAVLADSPVAYFRLGESAGAAVKDETGHYAATYLAGTTFAVSGALAGDPNTAIRMGLIGGGVLITGSAFDFAGATPFSLEAWVKPAVVDANYRFVFHHGGIVAGVRQDYGVNIQNMQGLTFERFVDGTNQPAVLATPPTVGAWHHIVAVYDAMTLVLYLDGVNVAQAADARGLVAAPGAFYIGAVAVPTIQRGIAGDLDEVAVYDKALSSARVQVHYAAAR